ncbi:MAG: glycerate kinase [Anaerolineales bacterium]
MEYARFFTHSLEHPRIARILSAALQAVEPGAAVQRYLDANPLPKNKRIFALGLGKAAVPMTEALCRFTTVTAALVITKHASTSSLIPATVILGGHPLPNENSLKAGLAALDFVSKLNEEDLLICLISGGGSALMSAPIISLEEMQTLTAALLACGARIDEINTLRRHLDRVKGGGIANTTKARVLSLILSDVVGNPLEAIASGPTAPDPTTKEDALAILEKYKLLDQPPKPRTTATQDSRPSQLRDFAVQLSETLKPNDPFFSRVQNVIVADNETAARAALAQAEKEGFQTEYLGSHWQGEAREVGRQLAKKLRGSEQAPLCFVAGGETTVTLRGDGVGGRNQELALAAVEALDGLQNVMLITLATDGEDGPTDAAGAVVTGETCQRAKKLGLSVAGYLSQNDAYHFFEMLGDLLKIGPTSTNVNDLAFCFFQDLSYSRNV